MGYWRHSETGDEYWSEESLENYINECVGESIDDLDLERYVNDNYTPSVILYECCIEHKELYEFYEEVQEYIFEYKVDQPIEGEDYTCDYVSGIFEWIEEDDDDEPSFNRKPLKKGSRKNRGGHR